MRIRRTIAASAIALATVGISSANAATSLFDLNPGAFPNQNFGGDLGIDFNVNSPITVTSLGAYSDGATPIDVALYSIGQYETGGLYNQGATLITSTVITSGPAYYQYDFNSVAPVTLAPGLYQIMAYGYNGSNSDYNPDQAPGGFNNNPPVPPTTYISFNSLGGAVSLADGNPGPYGAAFYNFGTAGPAQTLDVYTTNYGAGNLIASVPEPATWAMMLVGFFGVGFMMRGSRRKDDAVAVA